MYPRPARDNANQVDGFLDVLAARVGISTALAVLVSICVGAGFYIQTVVTQLEENHSVFRDTQVRNGYVGMSDVQRLILIVQSAVVIGEMTEALKDDFKNATDILYVRADNFERQMAKSDGLQTGVRSVAALRDIVDIADAAIKDDFSNVQGLATELVQAGSEARSHMVQFLDETRRKADTVLEAQSVAVREQQLFLLASLGGLSIFGSVAILLLRREVLGRRAREVAERRVEFLAYFDPLTNLPNRVQFQERLQKKLDEGQPLALLLVDLDDFKIVNDTYGHAAGDAVLKHIATKLGHLAAANLGFAARLGGDEFAIVLPGDDTDMVIEACEEAIVQTRSAITFEGETLSTTVSVGACSTKQIGYQKHPSVDHLSRVTDFALYASKSEGRNQFTIYDQPLEQRFLERRAMLEELPQAINAGDLEVHFQPKVMLPEGEVFGFEALVRWRRGDRIVPPIEFIALAEESGLVLEIDRYVLERSTEYVAEWNERNKTHFTVSVNLSALHFNTDRIVALVQGVLNCSNLPAEFLTLEITETMEVRDWQQAQKIIAALHHLGCKIAIDDFGTGYSSLAYLRTTKANELKIDRSLVLEIETSKKARMLLSSVLNIARDLEMDVTVEGIETVEVAQVVQEMGARQAQGFLYGRPELPHVAMERTRSHSDASKHFDECSGAA